jgi:hypothetical protein
MIRYNFFATSTINLGDFLNVLPVLSGLHKQLGKYDLIIQDGMSKFNGIKEFLMYQDLFDNVFFASEFNFEEGVIELSCFASEDRIDDVTPIETCRYVNFLNERHNYKVVPDADFIIKYPDYDIEISDTYYVGDRWSHREIDSRRNSNLFNDLENVIRLDYSKPILENCYIIANLKKPLITTFTGVSCLADLLNKDCYVVWDKSFFNPEYSVGETVVWANGKDMQGCFEQHFYLNRNAKLLHYNELINIINKK